MKSYTSENGYVLLKELFSKDRDTCREYVGDLTDESILRDVLATDPDWSVRVETLRLVQSNEEILKSVALNDPDWRVRLLATKWLFRADGSALLSIANQDENEEVRSTAAAIIHERLRQSKFRNDPEYALPHKMLDHLPKEEKRHRFLVEFDEILLYTPEGEAAFSIRPTIETYSFPSLTASFWYDISKAILASKENEQYVRIEDVPLAGRAYSTCYIRIKPLSGNEAEIVFIECASGCPRHGCTLRKKWETDPDALIDGCADYYGQYRVILPYAELRKAAVDAVLFNEHALNDFQNDFTCQWETEERDAGIRY